MSLKSVPSVDVYVLNETTLEKVKVAAQLRASLKDKIPTNSSRE